MEPIEEYDVFFVYNNKQDLPVIEKIADELRRHELKPWVGDSVLMYRNFEAEKAGPIEASKCFAVCIGEAPFDEMNQLDVGSLPKLSRPIITVLIDNGSTEQIETLGLASYPLIDLRRGVENSEEMGKLLEFIKAIPPIETYNFINGIEPIPGRQNATQKAAPVKKTKRPTQKRPEPQEIPVDFAETTQSGVRIQVALTSRGWRLPVDGLVIPAAFTLDVPGGAFYRALQNDLQRSTRDKLHSELTNALPSNGISFIEPALAELPDALATKVMPHAPGPAKIILATTRTAHGDNEIENVTPATRAVIELAGAHNITHLAMPLFGTGTKTDEQRLESARRMFNALLAIPSFGSLKQVTVLTIDPAVVNLAREQFNILNNNRVQKLSNDQAQGEDRLGIAREVYSLADALCLRDVEPPLAVGVMGGWGSGKSFVIHLLQKRMAEIRAEKVKPGPVGPDGNPTPPVFVGHIYQIKFNAWTYAKSNLWASLMYTVFFELNRQMMLEQILKTKYPPLEGDKVYTEIYRENFRITDPQLIEEAEKLPDQNVLWYVLREKKQEELSQLRNTEQTIEQVKASRERAEKQLSQPQVELTPEEATAAAQTVKNKVIAIAGEVLGDAAKKTLEAVGEKNTVGEKELKSAVDSIKSISSVAQYIWELRKNRRNLLWVVAFITVTLLLPIVLNNYLVTTVQKVIAAAVPFVVASLPILKAIGEAFEKAKKAAEEFEKLKLEAHQAKQKKDADDIAEGNLPPDTDKPAESGQPAETGKPEKGKPLSLSEKIASLRAAGEKGNLYAYDRLLELLEAQAEEQRRKAGPAAKYASLIEFVQSRLDASSYEGQLGLMHQVRQDLDELTASLTSNNTPELFPRGQPRIVLFIDDLDRCPPFRVVEVLEAVQLLLNTELFVVVLGLDTRYVTRALEKRYKEILQHEGDPSGLDYIEKIIQIPYRVRSMEADGIRNYLRAQMDISAETPPPVQQNVVQTPPPEKGRRRRKKAEPAPPVVPAPSVVPTPIVELPPAVIMFKQEDFEDLTACCTQVDLTPRSAKRLVNVLKLLKIFWFRTDRSDRAREVKQSVISLLALAAAYPEVMREAFVYLENLYRTEANGQKLLFTALAEMILPDTLIAELTTQFRLFRQNLEGLRKLNENKFASITLKDFGPSTLNLVRSFSFVGDPMYWAYNKEKSPAKAAG